MRYALYFSPAENDPLVQLASRWLGYDAFSSAATAQPGTDVFSASEHAELVADPKRYGFHATLKAPFSLASSVTERDLLEVAADFAARTKPFEIPKLVLGQLGRFFALVPAQTYPQLQEFAGSVVKSFEPLRAALSEADIARRKPEGLTEPQRAHLMRWGYPYVFEEFRFHMTLTGQVAPERQAAVHAYLSALFADHTDRPLAINGMAVFVEKERGVPFTVQKWLPLGSA